MNRHRPGWVWLPALLFLAMGSTWAGDPEGRAGLWELGVTTGFTVIDAGFNARVLGFEVKTTSGVPPTSPDNVDSRIPTFGVRAGYSLTRFFSLEVLGSGGTTEIGGNTKSQLLPDFNIQQVEKRREKLVEQTATAPGIKASLTGREFDYLEGEFNAVFSFNNRPSSRWVFFFNLGGGVYSLDTDTEAFNNCASGPNARLIIDPTLSQFNDNGAVGSADGNDPNSVFPDNPRRISAIDPGCERAFPIARLIRANPDILTLGRARFRNSEPLFDAPNLSSAEKIPSRQAKVPFTGEPIFLIPPGVLADPGFRTINPIKSISSSFYSAGGGVTWHFRPRQMIRIEGRRHFDESINKNINLFKVGYSFLFGRGRAAPSEKLAPPEDESVQPGDEVPPPEDVPPPDEPPEDSEAGKLTKPAPAPAPGSGDDVPPPDEVPPPDDPPDSEAGRLTVPRVRPRPVPFKAARSISYRPAPVPQILPGRDQEGPADAGL